MAVTETYSLGVPVAISRIDKELKKLWHDSAGAMTRASLMNLAVYSEEPGSLNNNTQLMAKIAENHACRAIVIEADCNARTINFLDSARVSRVGFDVAPKRTSSVVVSDGGGCVANEKKSSRWRRRHRLHARRVRYPIA